MDSSFIVNEKQINFKKWDQYIVSHPFGTAYHCTSFLNSIQETYGHKNYSFALSDMDGKFLGVLPLFLVKSIITGNSLISIPFCDYGGVLSDSIATSEKLFDHAIALSRQLKCKTLELRQTYRIDALDIKKDCMLNSIKARMYLPLPDTSETLFSSFPDKLRSQIRKPIKEGYTISNGKLEFLDDFYRVFVVNMRELGSPVHSKKMIGSVLKNFGDQGRIFVVYKENFPVACSLVLFHNKTVINPWASFNKAFRRSAPNMLLYWGMLEYSVNNGYKEFDFGRSSIGEGTYKFKTQWGAKPQQLYWYIHGGKLQTGEPSLAWKRKLFTKMWSRMPLRLSVMIGPVLRRQIPL